MFQIPDNTMLEGPGLFNEEAALGAEPVPMLPGQEDLSSFLDALETVDPFADLYSGLDQAVEEPEEGPIALSGEDLDRFKFRFDLSLSRAKVKMQKLHEDVRMDRAVYKTLEREQEYPGQPNLTTPLSSNKTDGLLSIVVDALEHRPFGSFIPEGIGQPAEDAAQVAPLCSAYLEREINRTHSREKLVREISKEAIKVGTGIARLGMVRHPSGEWFVDVTDIIKMEHFFVDRVAVSNLKHCFSAYEQRMPFYELEEMADAGLIDRTALDTIRDSHSAEFIRTVEEEEAGHRESSHAYQEETAIHKVYYGYMRFRAAGDPTARIYEAIWSDQWKTLLAVRHNPVSEAFDHPPIGLARIGKEPKFLFGRGVMRRMSPIQQMADNAINSHLALNDLAASPPFLYKMNSPFGRLMTSKRRILPGVGIPTLSDPDRGDVRQLEFTNPGLNLQDISVAQSFADKATFTEEAIGTSDSSRKTLGQFRVEMQRGTMRVRLDLGDLAYDLSTILTMYWSMMVAYKLKPKGVVEIEDGGKLLGAREITEQEITRVMDSLILPLVEQNQITYDELVELEEAFNERLTADTIPSGRRADLTIMVTGTKIIADKAAELEMLNELTPYILEGIELAQKDSYWNYHLRSIIEAMGFKDIEKRIPPDPGVIIEEDGMRQQLGDPMAQVINRSSNMI